MRTFEPGWLHGNASEVSRCTNTIIVPVQSEETEHRNALTVRGGQVTSSLLNQISETKVLATLDLAGRVCIRPPLEPPLSGVKDCSQ